MELINANKKLPKKGELVLLLTENYDFTVGSLDEDEYGSIWRIGNENLVWDFSFNLGDVEVIGWMELPDAKNSLVLPG